MVRFSFEDSNYLFNLPVYLQISQYAAKEVTILSEHNDKCKKMASDFELKLKSVNEEKDKEIDKLHAKIAQLQTQFSESLVSFEKHENAISAKETEKEVYL